MTIVVHEPQLLRRGATTRVTAWIEIPAAGTQEIWFEADDEGVFASEGSDAFAATALPLACALGVPLEVRGRVSPRLAWGLRELLRLHRLWWPMRTKHVEMTFRCLEEQHERGVAVGCGFSGGVDSFFSLLRHVPRNETIPAYAITHMVMINGFDFDRDLDGDGWFEALLRVYRPLAAAEGVRLMTIRTNMAGLFRLDTGVHWHDWLGMLLAVPALAFGRGFGRYYIGSAEGYADLASYGSSPLTDPWFSTDGLQIIHDGAEATRIEKLTALAGWPRTWDLLRVCRDKQWRNVDVERGVVDNCGRCEKCVRTRIVLELIGKETCFTTFRGRLTPRLICSTRYEARELFFARENLRLAREKQRLDIAAPIVSSILLAYARRIVRPIVALVRRSRRDARVTAENVVRMTDERSS
jgi:hypothetical protein